MDDRGKSPQRTRSEPDRDPTIRVADIAVVANGEKLARVELRFLRFGCIDHRQRRGHVRPIWRRGIAVYVKVQLVAAVGITLVSLGVAHAASPWSS